MQSYNHLLTRKRDIFAAIQALEQDRQDGVLDEDAYGKARLRFELEAAEILQRLDSLAGEPSAGDRRPSSHRRRLPPWLLAVGAASLVAAALAVFLTASLHPRAGATATQATASSPSSAAPSPRLLAAQAAVRAHPRSPDAYIRLGNVYFDGGLIAAADQSYRHAVSLDPQRPEARTLHAMALASTGNGTEALALLRQVERAHPGYARAWLLDGLLSSGRHQYRRAIASWQRFLTLNPKSGVAQQVRKLIAAAQRMQRSGK